MIVNFFETSANFGLAPDQAIEHFKGKGLKQTYNWYEMLGQDHDLSFTVAKMMDDDLLMTIRSELDKAMATGSTLADFKKNLIPTLQKKGWWGKKDIIDAATGHVTTIQLGSASRLENIFRTNMQSSYAAGQWQGIQEAKQSMPYLMYDAVDDGRARPEHDENDGAVYPIDDPFWESFYPPNGWGCRCGTIQMDDDDLADHGLSLSPPKAPKYKNWTNPLTGNKTKVPVGVDPGFNHNAGISQKAKLDKLHQEKIAKIAKEDAKAAQKAQKGAEATKAKAEKAKAAKKAAQEAKQKKAFVDAENQAKAELDAIEQGNATKQPGLKKKALAKAKKGGADKKLTNQELLKQVTDEAAEQQKKAEKSSALAGYKKKIIEGKEPTPKQKQVYDELPDEAKTGIQAEIDIKTGQAAAQEELFNIANGAAAKQPGLKKKILDKWEKSGKSGEFEKPKSLLKAVEEEAQAQQAKAEKSSVLSGYKKKIIDGKLPTKKQQELFDSLDEVEQNKILADIDKKKPIKPVGIDEPKPKAKPKPKAAKIDEETQAQHDLEYLIDNDPLAKATVDTLSDLDDNWHSYSAKEQLSLLKEMAEDAGETFATIPKVKPKTPGPANKIDMDNMDKIGQQGGSNPGGTFVDRTTGKKYYIKHMDNADKASNEVLAGKLYKEAGIEVPEMHYLKQGSKHHGNEHHVLSEIIDGLESNPGKLKQGIPGTNDGFVVDAWLGNWDVVGLEYDNLLVKGGRAVRVDTGGALRYRAQGSLKGADWDNNVNELESLIDGTNQQSKSVFGDISKAQQVESAKRVLSISDNKIKELVKKHAHPDIADELADKLIARKAVIAKKYPEAKEKPAQTKKTDKITATEVKNIESSRGNGYTRLTDEDQIEDNNLLFTNKTNVDGKSETSAFLKIRTEKAKELNEKVKNSKGNNSAIENANTEIEAALRSINHKISKGLNIEQSTQDKVKKALKSIYDVDTALRGVDNKALKAFNLKVEKWEEILANNTTLNGKPSYPSEAGFFKPIKIKIENNQNGPSWTRTKTNYSVANIRKGHIRQTEDTYSIDAHHYETEINGVKVKYWPDESDVLFALRGRIEIDAPGKGKASTLQILKAMDELGISTKRATQAYREQLYIKKLAYIHKFDKENTWLEITKEASESARLIKMRAYIDKKMDGITKTPHYKPFGESQAFGQGRVYTYRPELLNDPEFSAMEKTHRLYHANTGSMSMPDLVEAIINGGGQMATTADKMRRGIRLGGMSPESDLRSGGASYFFTRIRRKQTALNKSGFVWKLRQAARTDAITYNDDHFGRVTDDFVQKHRKTTVSAIKDASGGSVNETIFKDSLSIFDDLEVINVNSISERDSIVKMLKAHGYKTWPDGRKLEEVIKVV